MTIGFDLGCDLDLEFSRSDVEFTISRPKMVRLPWNKSKHIDSTLSLKWNHWIWPWPWPWPWIFEVKYGIRYISAKVVRLPRNKKLTCRFKSKPQMWPSDLTLVVTLTLNFQGQVWNSLYLGQKWFDSQETKSKHNDSTLSLKCDHQI